MTGVVLALAGLACGDGGPGMGAARAAVAVNLSSGRWEGEGRLFDVKLVRTSLVGGALSTKDGQFVTNYGRLTFRPDGIATTRYGTYWTYSVDDGWLKLRYGSTRFNTVFILRPAAPPKP